MQTELKSLIPTPSGPKLVTLFGYSTRSVPTLEIHGLGKSSKVIKEKILFMTKERKLKIPTHRFSLCIDHHHIDDRDFLANSKWLEFPLIVLYWYLIGHLSISHLNDCITSGQLFTSGRVIQPFCTMIKKHDSFFTDPFLSKFKVITSELLSIKSKQIIVHDLLSHIPNLKISNA